MSRILVFTDSLGLPRDTPENVLYEQTWPSLLREKDFEVIQISVGGGTIFDLYKQAAYYMVCKPEFVILQVGIVDCAPRMLTFNENLFYNNFKISRKILSIITPRWGDYLRKLRNIYYVKPVMFIKYLHLFLDFFPNSKVFSIGILPVCTKYEDKIPGITKRVVDYNKLLSEMFGTYYIDMGDIPFSYIMSDFHHLNEKGHRFVVSKLEGIL